MQEFLLEVFDAAAAAFALLFYIFVAGMGIYAMGMVVYNVILAHRRHKEERPEPPTARLAGTVYPDGKGGEN